MASATSLAEPSWALADNPNPADIDWDLIERLWSDRTLVDLAEIADMCGMTRVNSAATWQRAAQNYLVRGHRSWPPSTAILRQCTDPADDGAAPVTWYPVHPSLLPPPDVPGKRGQNRWYKGTIYRWGMQTRRLDLTGQPLRGQRGPAKGRGPTEGRRLRAHRESA